MGVLEAGTVNKLTKTIMRTASAAAVALCVAAPAQAIIINFYDNNVLTARLTTSGTTDFKLEFLSAPAAPGTAYINDIFLTYTGSTSDITAMSNLGGDTAGDATFSAPVRGAPLRVPTRT